MSVIRDYLETKWDEEGIIPALHTIEEDLQDVISEEEAYCIPNTVERFMQFIRASEGVILYGKQLPVHAETGMEIQAS